MKPKVFYFCKYSFEINFECKCSNHSDKKMYQKLFSLRKNYFDFVSTVSNSSYEKQLERNLKNFFPVS